MENLSQPPPAAAHHDSVNIRPPIPEAQHNNEGPTSRPCWIWAIGIVDVFAVIFAAGILVHDMNLKRFHGKSTF